MRTSRYAPRLNHELTLTPRDLEILLLFRSYRLLPTNWIHAFVGGGYVGVQNRLTALASNVYSLKTGSLIKSGFLERFNFNGSTNVNGVLVYRLTERGDQKLTELGYPPTDTYDRSHDNHQALLDLVDASIELGARQATVQLMKWPEIAAHSKTPKLPEKPFRFDTLVPDGRPFALKTERGAALFLKELDRSTESHKTILHKLTQYKSKEAEIKARYGFRALLILLITTSEARRQNLCDLILQAFPRGCEWILTHTIDDYTVFGRKPDVTTHLFDTPWQRAGSKPFLLKTLSEV